MDIREHMEIVDSEGKHVGAVDKVEGDRIKLTKTDSPDGQHHFIETKQVASVEGGKVKLSRQAA
ncbi:MAG: DUF2171 domain-containing protein [Bradyrhizobium sp.]|uniref:DUF2171 domain-containing protein n=1 Tax=Bradyrhizobium sp. TaxID=376 RepID=UPI001D92AFD1|nr:DUF2171 domain-containing protein [Bradyrhizobium sp.]MBV9563470.1 DUF2171 domain-containing protein [Bradyrhizobium sp.]